MWGYFMGREYAHRRYGPNAHSAITEYYSIASASPPTFLNSWYAINENRGERTDHRFEWEHIPACLLHDLIDNDIYNRDTSRRLNEANLVADTVRGYSIATIYNLLDGSTSNPSILMDKLRK